MSSQDMKDYGIIKTNHIAHDYDIYITGGINDNTDYIDLLNTLRKAEDHDRIKMYIANYGGSCQTIFQLINAVQEAECGVHMIVDAGAYSAAAILALSGISLTLNPGSFLMFHNYSGGSSGKGKEALDGNIHFYNHFHRRLEEICYPFLTKEELDKIKNDGDLYIAYNSRGLGKRISRHFKRNPRHPGGKQRQEDNVC